MEDSQKVTLQEGITKVLQHMITSNSNSPVISSRFHSHSAPAMSIGSYVERIVKYTRCSCEALVGSLMFLQYHVTFSGHCITIFNVHRMLITSAVLSAKSRDDEYYTNTYYAKIGGIPASELKTLEIEYISLMDWDCWLDRDAFEETVAMLTELALSNPSPDDIAQIVSFWEQKQSRLANARRCKVRKAIEDDVEIEARKVAALAANSFSSSAIVSPQSATNIESFNAVTFAPSTTNAFDAPSSGNTHRDPLDNSGSGTSGSNLVVTAPCFYPPSYKGARQASVPANSSTGAVPKKLGINPYASTSSSGSPYVDGNGYFPNPYSTSYGASRLNPYAQQHQPASANPFSKPYGSNKSSTPSAASGTGGNYSAFPSQPANNNSDDANSGSQPHTPVGDNTNGFPTGSPNSGKPPLVSNRPGSWASVVGTNNATTTIFNTRSGSNNGGLLASVNNGNGSGNNSMSGMPATPNGNSPSVVPQGAPGFGKPAPLNANQIQSGSYGTPHASPGGVVNNGTPRTANNNRLLTKHRFASGDNLQVSGSGFSQRTPESSRYSIVGVNPNQHPNSYHYYHTTAAADEGQTGIVNRTASPTPESNVNKAATRRMGSNAGPGIKLTNSDDLTPAAASYTSVDEASNSMNKAGGEENSLSRAGSKRGAGMRQSGKKREVPTHWEQDER